MGLFVQARDAARHSAMHDRSSRQVSLTFDLANRQLVDASPEGALDAARRRYAEAQRPLQQQAAQKAAGERALRTAGMENLNRIVDATSLLSSGGSSDAARRRYAEAQQPLQQQAAQQAAAERAMRMAGVDKLKAKLGDGLCAVPDDADSNASCGGAGGGSGGGASLGNGVSGGTSLASNAAAAAESGDFANATLTGRSLEVASALGSLFADRGRKDPTQGTASNSSSSSKSGGKGSSNGTNRNSKKGNASKPPGAGIGGSIAGLEAALAPWRPEQRRRKGVEIGGGLI